MRMDYNIKSYVKSIQQKRLKSLLDQVGLVLEGGGMRSVYTGGVLEYFLEQEIFFPYVNGNAFIIRPTEPLKAGRMDGKKSGQA